MYTFRADISAANDNGKKRRQRWFWGVLLSVLLIGLVGYFQGKRYLLDGLPDLPNKKAMWEMNVQPSITLLDKNGKVIGHRGPYYGRPLKLSEMPLYLSDAFLAIEDQRFYEHPGIDRKAILRALLENTKTGRRAQGGSTLTQQLVRNMVLSREKTYKRKFQEMWLSYKIEQVLTKPEILELYLNRIDLGNRSFGVEAAAQRYFGKSAISINLAEAAVLAALPKATTAYDPTRHPAASQERARLVLHNMMVQGKISPQEMAEAETNAATIISGSVTTFDDNAMGHIFDLVADKAENLIGSQIKDLIIRTTIDPKLQNHAQASISTVIDTYKKSKKVSEGALVSIQTDTGAIRALVGGRDYKNSKFNRATQAQRQPGSAFKAFVYASALETGMTPGTVRVDQPVNIAGWAPENYTKRYRGPMTLREALKLSINTIAAQVGAEIGPDKVVEIAHRFGIASKLGVHYSISLGSSEVNLLELTSAYMVFANEGLRKPPYIIEHISDTANTELYTHRTAAPERVYATPYARQMTGMLRDVIDSGTGHGARLGNRPAAGKTGTSQDYRDAWFIGFTADFTTGVWLGNDDNSSMRGITGGLLPVDAWKKYMRKAQKGKKYRPLNAPDPFINDAETQALVQFYQTLSESFIAERNLANGLSPQAASPNR